MSMRQPKQVLIIPYILIDKKLNYLVLTRASNFMQQFVSGGVEDDETHTETAYRELGEELNIYVNEGLICLDSTTMIPANNFKEYNTIWPEDTILVNEKSFAIKITNPNTVKISDEHSDYKWCSYEQALERLTWDSNKTALFELHTRIQKNLI